MAVDYKLIGTRVKAEREKKHYTQEQLAEIIGITPVYLSKIENGKARPTLELLSVLAYELATDVCQLLSGVDTKLSNYQNDKVLFLFNECAPSVKPIALSLLSELAKLK